MLNGWTGLAVEHLLISMTFLDYYLLSHITWTMIAIKFQASATSKRTGLDLISDA
jgi:hypothetical protein